MITYCALCGGVREPGCTANNTRAGDCAKYRATFGSGAKPLVGPLTTDAVGVADLLPRRPGAPCLVGHPGDPVVGFLPRLNGGGESAQRKVAQVVTAQPIDRDGGSIGGTGAAQDVLDGRANLSDVHVSRVDDNSESVKG